MFDNLPFFRKEQRQLPPIVPSDEVVPVHLFDDSAATRGIILVATFKFAEVLDPAKLNDALSELFQMPGWRKLSGRFRYRDDGGLEIHVPNPPTKERPAVQFSREDHEFPMSEHPLASRLPQPTGKIETYPGPKEFCSLGQGPYSPRNLDDYVYSGTPQFCLHVQKFTDGTLVSLTLTHISTDLVGLACIIEAWSLVLAGKSEAVVPMAGYREDPFDGMVNPAPKERHVLQDRIIDGWRFNYWGLRSLFEAWRCPDIESRTLCIPKNVMAALMKEARGHIEDDIAAAPSGHKPFISEGDVLTAVACRILAQYQGPGSSREMATIMALDPRGRVKSVFRQDTAYVQNSPTNIYFFCHADKAVEMPVGQLALAVRNAIAAQTTEEQLKAAAYLSAKSIKASQMPVIFGDKDMATQFMSNWTKGHLLDKMDFAPAVVKDAAPELSSKPGHPIYYQASDPSHSTVSVISSVFVVVGKDYEENTWFSISVPGKMWSDLLEFLNRFA
ncbi:hypothetical protein ONS95_006521 [Cadophora gregata]|uniref:uncharacterized protein n=1 Tax=Cadophora gregata TaxID=51156 RepID=UPI0026DABD97|nr:uncharacterized protein ONS95_006521 [Cadophora gregata]KAK0101345.1 hypothetical protein ONS95_006521 [Cadophora gregata]KAK0106645.1 hypothetical protein ONS96_004265 [Cadophora gregata f. sp. sojae]